MNIFRTLDIGAVALGAAAIATPAQAHDHHRGGGHWDHGRNWGHHSYYRGYYGYGGPRYYGYYGGPYYYDSYPGYSYYQPYYYGGPSISFAFGGHRGWYGGGHHWHH